VKGRSGLVKDRHRATGNLSTTSATQVYTAGYQLAFAYGGLVVGNSALTIFDFAPVRFSLSGAQTIWLVGLDSFGTSTVSSAGWLRARRAR
jgi:hypothetical protein